MRALTVTRLSLREAVSRRLVLIGMMLSVVFLGLFAFGFDALFRRVDANEPELAVAGTFLTVLALYMVRFLAALLAIFLSSSAIASEIDSGVLHAVLARPLSRTSWLGQRWLAFALITVGYVAIMGSAVMAIANAIGGYRPFDPARALAIMALELVVLLAIGLLASSRWSTVTSGVVTFCLFGVAWLAGIIEVIGDQLANRTMQMIGIATSLLVPSDALWRGASYYLQPPSVVALVGGQGGANPFAGSAPPTTSLLVWSVGYAAVLLALSARRLARRDL